MTHSTNPALATRKVAWLALTLITIASLASAPAYGQNFTSDARLIGMGAVGGNKSDANRLAGDTRQYRAIGVPLGLFQVFKNTKIFDPGDPEFNPIRGMEYAANPLHFTVNREGSAAGGKLVRDLINSDFDSTRDLNSYKGFVPVSNIEGAGLLSPNWGKTFKVSQHGPDSYQGFYVGAGPYVSIGTSVDIDPALINIFASSANVYVPNATFLIGNTTGLQTAVALTGGYRARLPIASSGKSNRNGVFVAANFNYLRGVHYESADLDVQLETDSNGYVTLTPSSKPIAVDRLWAQRGKGYSIDLSTEVVVDRWNAGFAVEGIGNNIEWTRVSHEKWELDDITNGAQFTNTALIAPPMVRVELPVRYSANAGYRIAGLFTAAEFHHGLQKNEFHGGAEYQFLFLEFRGGMRYTRPNWNPTAGMGLNLGKRLGIDVAGFGTTTNVERNRKLSLAVSLRINSKME